jgi:hypothetical protein
MTHRVTESADQPPDRGAERNRVSARFFGHVLRPSTPRALASLAGAFAAPRPRPRSAPTPADADLSALAAGTFIYFGRLHGLANGTLVARRCEFRSYSLPDLNSAVAGFGTYSARTS